MCLSVFVDVCGQSVLNSVFVLCVCFSPGQDSVPAGGEEGPGEPEERPG